MRDWASVLHSNDLLERRLPLAPASRPQLRSGDQVPNKNVVNMQRERRQHEAHNGALQGER